MNNYRELAKKINDEIKSSELKELLFDTTCVMASQVKGVCAISKLLSFGFIVAFIKWRNDHRKKIEFPRTPNANRVFDMFNGIYNGENVELDLMIYSLTEMQLDEFSFGGGESYFNGLISGGQDTVQIPSLRPLIKTALQSSRKVEKSEEVLVDLFLKLYNTFPFLKDCAISFEEEDLLFKKLEVNKEKQSKNMLEESEENFRFKTVKITLKPGSQPLDSNMLLIKNSFGSFYLSSFENIDSAKTRFFYYSLDGRYSYGGTLPTTDFNRRIANRSNGNSTERSSPIIAKSMFSLNYKYIKNLSLALSDTIRDQTKLTLKEHFKKNHDDIFDPIKRLEELEWDNIITTLIVEKGPTALLEFILEDEGYHFFEAILKNLGTRYHKPNFACDAKAKYKEALDGEWDYSKNDSSDGSTIARNICAISRSLMAKSIIEEFAELENRPKESKAMFVESLAVRINNIERINSSDDSIQGKTLRINQVLEKTFRYMIPFYYGVFAYQQEKENLFNALEAGDEINITKDEKKELFGKCDQKFFEAAGKIIDDIRTYTLGELVYDAFSDLCKLASPPKGHIRKFTPEWKMLKSALGRDRICSWEKVIEILDIRPDERTKKSGIKLPKDIIEFINNEKHDKGHETVQINAMSFNRFLVKVNELLYFLVFNEDDYKEKRFGHHLSFDPIYPFVVRYNAKSENRDGYNINSFMVSQADDSIFREIKILSEREYEINEKYYCIPNESMSNRRWWIEPFLISCRKYNDFIQSRVVRDKN